MSWAIEKPMQIGLGLLGFGVALFAIWWWMGRPPQMSASKESFAAVDALFTAVSAKDQRLLGQCEHRLETLATRGEVDDDVLAYLGGIITEAKAGNWEKTTRKLYTFMRAQRRDLTQRPG